MALLSISDDHLPDRAALAEAVAGVAPDAPLVVLIHGFRFDPADPGNDPHRHILSMTPVRDCWKAVSWPRHLGLTGRRGLAIGWGWRARGSIWAAHAEAKASGIRLAALLQRLARVCPGRPVHLFAHSLGARVALTALALVPKGTVGRIVLLSAAAFEDEAMQALESPAGRSSEVVTVRGAENALFDVLLRATLPFRGPTLGGAARCEDLTALPRFLDLRLDRAATLAALHRTGWRIAPPKARVCHWSGYLRPGVWAFYRALLHRPAEVPLAVLRAAVTESRPETTRWFVPSIAR